MIQEFRAHAEATGVFGSRRKEQTLEWLRSAVEVHLKERFFKSPQVRAILPDLESAVAKGELPPSAAVEKLLRVFDEGEPGK